MIRGRANRAEGCPGLHGLSGSVCPDFIHIVAHAALQAGCCQHPVACRAWGFVFVFSIKELQTLGVLLPPVSAPVLDISAQGLATHSPWPEGRAACSYKGGLIGHSHAQLFACCLRLLLQD